MSIELKNMIAGNRGIGSKVVGLVLGFSLLISIEGCYHRKIAPELSYDPDQVEQIRSEIEKFDWSE